MFQGIKLILVDLFSITFPRSHLPLIPLHQQELLSVRENLGYNVNVNVQAAESINLSQVMADIRAEYEALIEHNRRQAEAWYMKQVR